MENKEHKKDYRKESGKDFRKNTKADNDIDAAEQGNDEPNVNLIEGRNVILEAMRSGTQLDRIFIQEGLRDNTVASIIKLAKQKGVIFDYVKKERLSKLSPDGNHQGVVAYAAAYDYVSVEDILAIAEKKGEPPFIIILDEIEDPHNLGAIIRTANLAGAHGVIIPKRRAVGLTAAAAKASAGAYVYTPVARVTNISKTIDELKSKGMWFACADMQGQRMYDVNLTGAIGLVIGNEGSGVSRIVREKCDYLVSIPMFGQIDSLNASVACGVLAYEIVRQRLVQPRIL